MPPRRLSEHERAEWLSFAQAMGAKPLRPPSAEAAEALAITAPSGPGSDHASDHASDQRRGKTVPAPPPPDPKPVPRPKLGELTVGGPAAGLDHASWEKLRRGRMRPERRLDLHGRTAQAAFGAFEQFIGAARADGIRCVEIVTGRGAGEGGVLRRELPLWLNLPQMRGAILAAVHPHRANIGAVVLLLRRVR